MIQPVPKYVIVTNNHAVADKYPELSEYINGSVSDIFIAVRDAVHKGAQVISHPLSGSIKPNESPYKSVVITASTGPLDFKSLNTIEDAIAVLARLSDRGRIYNESSLDDFRIIDLDLVNSAISSIQL